MSDFQKGYACAVSNLVSMYGPSIEAEQLLKSNELSTLERLLAAGIDEYDIEILKPVLESIASTRKHRQGLR